MAFDPRNDNSAMYTKGPALPSTVQPPSATYWEGTSHAWTNLSYDGATAASLELAGTQALGESTGAAALPARSQAGAPVLTHSF